MALQGNICRCTGYVNIVEAVMAAGGRPRRRPSPTAVDDAPEGLVGQSIPRKEDKRLVQGQGIFFDDIRRHGMGYVHFVRSPYAHAKIVSIDVTQALALDGVYGTITGDEVAIHTDPFFEMSSSRAGTSRTTRSPSARCGTRASRSPPSAPRRGSSRATRPSSSRSSTTPLPVLVDARGGAQGRGGPPRRGRLEHRLVGRLRLGRRRRGARRGRPRREDQAAPLPPLRSTPLECSGALVEYDRGTGQWTLHCNHQMPGVGAIWMAPALRTGIDKLRFVTQDIGGGFGNKICLHPQYVVLCLLARKLGPAGAVDGVAHRPAHGERARERAHVPRRRGRGEGRRHDDRLQGEGARRLRRVPALRAARLHHLGAGHAGLLRLAEHPRRLHAGLHEQVAGLAEPRLLADAAPLADRADHRHRRRRARARSRSRCASATT